MHQVVMPAASRLAFTAAAPVADPLMRPLGPRSAPWLGCAVLPEATLDYRAVRCPVRIAQGTHDLLSLSQSAPLDRSPDVRTSLLALMPTTARCGTATGAPTAARIRVRPTPCPRGVSASPGGGAPGTCRGCATGPRRRIRLWRCCSRRVGRRGCRERLPAWA